MAALEKIATLQAEVDKEKQRADAAVQAKTVAETNLTTVTESRDDWKNKYDTAAASITANEATITRLKTQLEGQRAKTKAITDSVSAFLAAVPPPEPLAHPETPTSPTVDEEDADVGTPAKSKRGGGGGKRGKKGRGRGKTERRPKTSVAERLGWMHHNVATEHALTDFVAYLDGIQNLRSSTNWKAKAPSLDEADSSVLVTVNMTLRRLLAVMATDMADEHDMGILQECYDLNRIEIATIRRSLMSSDVNGASEEPASPCSIMMAMCVVMRDQMHLTPFHFLNLPFGTLVCILTTLGSVAQIRGLRSVVEASIPDPGRFVECLDFSTQALCHVVKTAVCRATAFPGAQLDGTEADARLGSLMEEAGLKPAPTGSGVPPGSPPASEPPTFVFDAAKVKAVIESSASPLQVALQFMVVSSRTFCEIGVQTVVQDVVNSPTPAAQVLIEQARSLAPTLAATSNLRATLAALSTWTPGQEPPAPWTPAVVQGALARLPTPMPPAAIDAGTVKEIAFTASPTVSMAAFETLKQAATEESAAMHAQMNGLKIKVSAMLETFKTKLRIGEGDAIAQRSPIGLTSIRPGALEQFDPLAFMRVQAAGTLGVEKGAVFGDGETGATGVLDVLTGVPAKSRKK